LSLDKINSESKIQEKLGLWQRHSRTNPTIMKTKKKNTYQKFKYIVKLEYIVEIYLEKKLLQVASEVRGDGEGGCISINP